MSAQDNPKDDDPIARAIQRREARRGDVTPTEPTVGGGMDAVGVKPWSRSQSSSSSAETGPRDYEEPPTFFTRSREERAERARRAAQRVRRREQVEQVRDVIAPKSTEPDPEPEAKAPPAPQPEPVAKAPPAPEPATAKPEAKAPPPAAEPVSAAPAAKAPDAPQLAAAPSAPPRPESAAKLLAKAPPAPESRPAPPPAAKLPPSPQPRTAPTAAPAPAPAPSPAAVDRTPAPTPAVEIPDYAGKALNPAAPPQPVREVAASIPAASSAPPQTVTASPAVQTQTADVKPQTPKPVASFVDAYIEEDAAPAPAASTAAKATGAAGLGALLDRASAKKAAEQAAPPPRTVPREERKLMRQPVSAPTVMPGAETEPLGPRLDPVYAPNSALTAAKTKAFAPFEWMVASRYLRARKKEGFVSVIAGFSLVGIALGVATLIVVMAVMSGFRETLVNQVLGVSAHMNVASQSEKFENYDTLAEAIRQVDGIERVSPVVDGQVLATGNRNHTGVLVRGMRKEDLEKLNVVTAPEVASGSIDAYAGDSGVAIGANIAAKLNLRVGDFITLISPDGDITPFSATPMPRKKDYKVIYVFKIGLYEYDNRLVFMPFEEAQIYFNKKGVADSLEVIVDNPNRIEDYTGPVRQAARQSVSVYTWKDFNGSLIGALDIERKVMFIILTMIILVAALNIISGLVMLVKDKGRDVAIMRTMGMARGSILRIFFICGASIGVIGSIAGTVIGVLFALNIRSIQGFIEGITGASLWDPTVRMLSEIPSKLVLSDVALTLFIALGLSFLATLYPAWKAAKLDPVEALRYE